MAPSRLLSVALLLAVTGCPPAPAPAPPAAPDPDAWRGDPGWRVATASEPAPTWTPLASVDRGPLWLAWPEQPAHADGSPVSRYLLWSARKAGERPVALETAPHVRQLLDVNETGHVVWLAVEWKNGARRPLEVPDAARPVPADLSTIEGGLVKVPEGGF